MSARNSDNVQPLVDGFVLYGPKGTPMPIDVTSSLDAALVDVGWLTSDGFGEPGGPQTTTKKGINGATIRTIRTDDPKSFTFTAGEENKAVKALLRPGSTPVSTGAVAEVQTITITGTPTGGTITPAVPGIGSTTPLANNASAGAMAAALSALIGDTVSVSLSGAVYTVTFPTSLGNVGQMTVANNLTGGSSPTVAVATTTPGVAGSTSTSVKSFYGTNEKLWVIHYVYATYLRRVVVPKGEAYLTNTPSAKFGDTAEYQFRVDCMPMTDGTTYIDITTNPAELVS